MIPTDLIGLIGKFIPNYPPGYHEQSVITRIP